MHFLTRVTLTTFATCAVLGTTAGERPAWLRLDFNGIRSLYQQIGREHQRKGGLNELESTIHNRVDRKAEIALALAEGRLRLPQAAALFRELSQHTPQFWNAVNNFTPSGTEGEKLCRYVIDWAWAFFSDNEPEKAEAMADRLHAELDELLRSGRPLIQRPTPSHCP